MRLLESLHRAGLTLLPKPVVRQHRCRNQGAPRQHPSLLLHPVGILVAFLPQQRPCILNTSYPRTTPYSILDIGRPVSPSILSCRPLIWLLARTGLDRVVGHCSRVRPQCLFNEQSRERCYRLDLTLRPLSPLLLLEIDPPTTSHLR